MALNLPTFDDGFTLKRIREQSLNPVVREVNALDLKVRGLQEVTLLAMTQPTVDVKGKKITFKEGGASGTARELDLSPMFDDYQHGVAVRGETGSATTPKETLVFRNATVSDNGTEAIIDVNPLKGQVNSGATGTIKYIRITGNTAGASLDSSGTMTLNMPNNSIDASINGTSSENISIINVRGDTTGSSVSGGALTLNMPEPVMGSIVGGNPVKVKSLTFTGNTGTSTEGSGDMVINLPVFTGDADGTGQENIKGIEIIGNRGGSKVENEILKIDLPTGGGGTGTSSLTVGEDGGAGVPQVEEIWFKDAKVKVQTTRTGRKVLVEDRGIVVDKKDDPEPAKFIKKITLKGDVEGSTISESGLLELMIPVHKGLSVSDGASITSAGISSLEFKDSTVEIDSVKAQATVTPKGLVGKLSTGSSNEPVKEIEITGTLGGSSLSNGKLKIDLPAGGGGGTGSTIYGIVGSETAVIERVEVIGAKYNSSVNAGNKTLKVDIPNKPTIRGGGQQFSDIDIVEVANSTVTLSDESGKRRAFIVPHIPYMFEGWFQDISALNNYIPEAGRIPTKTCGYVFDHVTSQNVLMMWMPDYSGGFQWEAIEGAGSLTLMEGSAKVGHVDSITRNAMTLVDSGGRMTIKDTTVPEVVCETLDDASNPVQKGVFNQLQFVDGEGSVDFEPNLKTLKILRAQRRIDMGNNPDTTATQFTDDKYEGSIFLNKNDHCWWGFANRAPGVGNKKWTKIIHPEMSGDVSSLTRRLPQVLESIDTVDAGTLDHKLWHESGWTHIRKDCEAMPLEYRGKTGGYVETFVITDAAVVGGHHRYQMMHVETDAATLKRYWIFESGGGAGGTNKWSEWVKTSFNPAELKHHNEDPHAHRVAHPYYKTATFDCTYKELKDNNYYLPINSMHVLGSSDGRHKINEDQLARVAYDGKYRVRGHLYFRGVLDTPYEKDYGEWWLMLQRRKKGETAWNEVARIKYQHHTTSMSLPPLRWDIQNVDLKSGDDLAVRIQFIPKAGTTEEAWLATHPDIGFYGLRSYLAVDEQDNDGGLALGETHRKLHGRYVAIGNYGLKVFRDKGGTTTRVVDDTINTTSTEMKP